MNTPAAAPLSHRAWCTALASVAIILLLQAAGEPLRAHWRYERLAVLNGGEWWRLLSAHLVHLGWAHAALNAIGVVLCCAVSPELFSPRVLALRAAVLGLMVALMLLVFSHSVSHYVGLSGVLYGLLVLGLVPRARHGDRVAGVALLSMVGWALWQWLVGPSTGEERLIGGRIVAGAHLYGLLGAAPLLVVLPLQSRRDRGLPKRPRPSHSAKGNR